MSWRPLQPPKGEIPQCRGGHAMASIGDEVFLFGGANREPVTLDDAWKAKIDKDECSWTRIVTTDCHPKGRTGASATAVGKQIFLFGGYDPVTGEGFNDIHILDTERSQWSCPIVSGDLPEPRHSHSAVLHAGHLIVLFGGACETGLTDAVYTFDTDTMAWAEVKTSGTPCSAREMHAAAVVTRRVPHAAPTQDKSSSDNSNNNNGSGNGSGDAAACPTDGPGSIPAGAIGGHVEADGHTGVAPPAPAGDASIGPAGEQGKAPTLVHGSFMLVYGGRDGQGNVLSDVTLLDLDTMTWQPSQAAHHPRCSHTARTLSYTLRQDVAAAELSPLEATPADADSTAGSGGNKGASPRPRVLIYGGFSGEGVEGEVLVLDPEDLSVRMVADASSVRKAAAKFGTATPPPRFAHAAAVLKGAGDKGGDVLCVFGGVNPIEDLCDIAVWDPEGEGILPSGKDDAQGNPVFLEEIV
eukprot:jgi/Mesvir1/3746/Mv15021-RA.1